MSKKNKEICKEEIIIFARQLALVMDSDVSIYEGIDIIKSNSKDEKLVLALETILSNLGQGCSVTDAFANCDGAFGSYLIGMVEIGEKSGSLVGALNQVADTYERTLETSSKIKSAVTYPIILSILMLGVIFLLILLVIPTFEEILSSLGGDMPPFTQMIIDFSNTVTNNILVIAIVIIAIIASFFAYKSTDKGRYNVDKWKFQLPIFKGINSSLYATRFSRNLAEMVKNGIDFSIALNMIKPVMNNLYFDEKIDNAISMLNNGDTIDNAIKSLDIFPWILVRLFTVAQYTGHLDEMLNKAADVMEKDSDVKLEKLTTVVEPILIVILSVIIGIILLSVILPVISIMNSIG